jgi:hypothetical protein
MTKLLSQPVVQLQFLSVARVKISATATGSWVATSWVGLGCSLFAVGATGLSNTRENRPPAPIFRRPDCTFCHPDIHPHQYLEFFTNQGDEWRACEEFNTPNISAIIPATCYDKARTFHFLTFIYHVYYYSRSHDRRVFTFAHDSLRVFLWTAFPIRLDITHPSTPLTQY